MRVVEEGINLEHSDVKNWCDTVIVHLCGCNCNC